MSAELLGNYLLGDASDDREPATWWLIKSSGTTILTYGADRASAPNNLGLSAVIRGNLGLSGQFSHYRLAIPPTRCPYSATP